MEKRDIGVVLGILVLLVLVVIVGQSHWFVPDRSIEGDVDIHQESEKMEVEETGAVEISEKAEVEMGNYTVTEGVYYFKGGAGGQFDIISDTDGMQFEVQMKNGEHLENYLTKVLNKGCCLENFIFLEHMIFRVKGKGKVTLRTINGKNMDPSIIKGKIVFQNSGFYDAHMVFYHNFDKKQRVLCCQVNDASLQMPKIKIQDMYTGETLDEFQWKSGKERYVCKMNKKYQRLYVDLGNETEKKRNYIFVEK